MKNGNTIYVLIGQRGSGKSTYGKRLTERYPNLQVISRDEILTRVYGSTSVNPYSGVFFYVFDVIERLIRRKFASAPGARILLDRWTEDSRERKRLVQKLRELGADRVVALYFVTPLELVNVWFWQKPGIAKIDDRKDDDKKGTVYFLETAPEHDFNVFHELAAGIDSDGFDEVIRINPREELISLD